MLELYYVLMKNGLGNHKQAKTLIKHQEITVNGVIETNPRYIVDFDDIIKYKDKILKSNPLIYIMLNKPKGYISANKDKNYPCIVDLIEYKDCFCLGRLDIDTTGLMLLTNDTTLKKLLLPQNHIDKTYLVETLKPLNKQNQIAFKQGIIIDNDVLLDSAKLDIIDDYHCIVTIHEGKYHQIKKMFLSQDNKVINLKRLSFASIELDKQLKEGQSRLLTQSEIKELYKKIKG